MSSVVIYSASWCDACQKAKAWLKSKGVVYVEKDIDNDADDAELTAKLKKAGLGKVGIPVFDLAGRIHVGFDASKPPVLPSGSASAAPSAKVVAKPVEPSKPAATKGSVSSTPGYAVPMAVGIGVVGGGTVGYWAFDSVFGKGLDPAEKRQIGAFAVTMGLLGLAGVFGYDKWISVEGLSEKAEKLAR